jgi:hypothetical protein
MLAYSGSCITTFGIIFNISANGRVDINIIRSIS